MNVMTLFEQTDRALTLYANQFAGRSIVVDKFVIAHNSRPVKRGSCNAFADFVSKRTGSASGDKIHV
jgi:hypothetical protein